MMQKIKAFLFGQTKKPVDIVVCLQSIGGKLWEKGNQRRVYFNRAADLAGLSTRFDRYGNIVSATRYGKEISVTEAKEMIAQCGRIYYDLNSNEICSTGTDKAIVEGLVAEIRSLVSQAA